MHDYTISHDKISKPHLPCIFHKLSGGSAVGCWTPKSWSFEVSASAWRNAKRERRCKGVGMGDRDQNVKNKYIKYMERMMNTSGSNMI